MYEDAYKLYYKNNGYGSLPIKSINDWVKEIEAVTEGSETPEQANKKINALIDDYVNYFWTDNEGMTWAFGDLGINFTYLAGSNSKMEKKISNNFKYELLQGSLKIVFDRLAKQTQIKQEKEYRNALKELKNELNKVVKLIVIEESETGNLQLPGYIMQFAPLSDDADQSKWVGKMPKSGTARVAFTVLGHMLAGAPSKILFFETEDDMNNNNPEFVVKFTVEFPQTTIKIKTSKTEELVEQPEENTITEIRGNNQKSDNTNNNISNTVNTKQNNTESSSKKDYRVVGKYIEVTRDMDNWEYFYIYFNKDGTWKIDSKNKNTGLPYSAAYGSGTWNFSDGIVWTMDSSGSGTSKGWTFSGNTLSLNYINETWKNDWKGEISTYTGEPIVYEKN